jgi:hypothetical protein
MPYLVVPHLPLCGNAFAPTTRRFRLGPKERLNERRADSRNSSIGEGG